MGPNERVLRDAYARYSDGEINFGIMADDITWNSSGDRSRIATAGEWRGPDGVRDFFAALRQNWKIREHNVLDVVAQADSRFAIRVAVDAQHSTTGARVRFEKVDWVTMANGKCTSYRETLDTAPLERAAAIVHNAFSN
jgi:ketosteroid isomerase-like protein